MQGMVGQVMIYADGSQKLLVHYTYRDEDRVEHVACVPNLSAFEAQPTRPWPWNRSGETRAVTCPLCMETEAYLEAVAKAKAPVSEEIDRVDSPEPVHLIYRESQRGPWLMACKSLSFPLRSDDVRAVTCPACRDTAAFATLKAGLEEGMHRAAKS